MCDERILDFDMHNPRLLPGGSICWTANRYGLEGSENVSGLRLRRVFRVWMIGVIMSIWGCRPGSDLLLPGSVAGTTCSSLALAEIEGTALDACDLDRYAGWHLEIQKELGSFVQIENRFEQKLQAALNLLALSGCQKKIVDEGWLGEQKKRLIARLYLDRVLPRLEDLDVSEEELHQAHRDEVEKYKTTGESDIYRPTSVDAAVIMIGYFPDFHAPQDNETPVVRAEKVKQLMGEIQSVLGDRVADLDTFLALARGFMRGNPTVQVKEYSNLALSLDEESIEPELKKTILALKENAMISRPVWFSGGGYIVRRGVERPGKGESIREAEPELRRMVRLRKMEEIYQRQILRLKHKHQARSWPDIIERQMSAEGLSR